MECFNVYSLNNLGDLIRYIKAVIMNDNYISLLY